MNEQYEPIAGDGFPSAEDVTEEFNCARALCQSPAQCWSYGGCLRIFRQGDKGAIQPDTKGGSRIENRQALINKVLADPECRSCGRAASDPHHIVFRSQGGDDVEENVAPLCHTCHMTFHFSAGKDQAEVAEAIGKTFQPEEIAYVLEKLGDTEGRAYLGFRYYWNG